MSNKEYKKLTNAIDLIPLTYIDGDVHIGIIKRTEDPFKDIYTLPGGFIHYEDADFNTAIARILNTKLLKDNVDDTFYAEQIGTEMGLNRDPRGHVLSIFYALFVKDHTIFKENVEWFTLKDIPKLGFDHNELVKRTIKFLSNSMIYRPTALLMLDEFTLTDIINIDAALSNKDTKEFNRANYRKTNEKLYVETTSVKSEGAGRPAKIYVNNKFDTVISIKN